MKRAVLSVVLLAALCAVMAQLLPGCSGDSTAGSTTCTDAGPDGHSVCVTTPPPSGGGGGW